MDQKASLAITSTVCVYCNANLESSVSVKCETCKNFILCPDCFSLGAEIGVHQRTHPYSVNSGGKEWTIFDTQPPWTVNDLIAVVDGVQRFGFGSWRRILAAKNIYGKTSADCEAMFELLLNGNCATGAKHLVAQVLNRLNGGGGAAPDKDTSGSTGQTGGHCDVPVVDLAGAPVATQLHSPHSVMASICTQEQQKLLGYWPLRDEFELEFQPRGERGLADLIVNRAATASSAPTGASSTPLTSSGGDASGAGGDVNEDLRHYQLWQLHKYRLIKYQRDVRKMVAKRYHLLSRVCSHLPSTIPTTSTAATSSLATASTTSATAPTVDSSVSAVLSTFQAFKQRLAHEDKQDARHDKAMGAVGTGPGSSNANSASGGGSGTSSTRSTKLATHRSAAAASKAAAAAMQHGSGVGSGGNTGSSSATGGAASHYFDTKEGQLIRELEEESVSLRPLARHLRPAAFYDLLARLRRQKLLEERVRRLEKHQSSYCGPPTSAAGARKRSATQSISATSHNGGAAVGASTTAKRSRIVHGSGCAATLGKHEEVGKVIEDDLDENSVGIEGGDGESRSLFCLRRLTTDAEVDLCRRVGLSLTRFVQLKAALLGDDLARRGGSPIRLRRYAAAAVAPAQRKAVAAHLKAAGLIA